MGADNWAICPRCLKKKIEAHQKATQEAINAVESSYGKVTIEEFEALVRNLRELEGRDPSEIPEKDFTLREDYEIGTDESGTFGVNYRCSCKECGFSFKYNHDEQVESNA